MVSLPEVAKTSQFPHLQTVRYDKHFGEILCRNASAATVTGGHGRLLNITDVMTKVRPLLDTGAKLSILPANSDDRLRGSTLNLQVANKKPSARYGKRYVCLNVGLHKSIHCIFVDIDVFVSYIGRDLLKHHNPFIDSSK